MKITNVIPCRFWRNRKTGHTASLYGACPWTTESERPNWELIERGYTWQCSNGTVGLGRIPAKTREEALEVMERVNARHEAAIATLKAG